MCECVSVLTTSLASCRFGLLVACHDFQSAGLCEDGPHHVAFNVTKYMCVTDTYRSYNVLLLKKTPQNNRRRCKCGRLLDRQRLVYVDEVMGETDSFWCKCVSLSLSLMYLYGDCVVVVVVGEMKIWSVVFV